MARTRTTKTVAQRIDLNYFKRATPFKKAKLWLAIVAPAIAVVWIGWHVWGRDNRVYSSGRLSEAHAVLERECAACHVQQAGGFSAAAADSACLACHDGPAHHASNMNTKVACAECHVEHRGRLNLVATKNQSCAQCHGNLPAASRDSKYAKHIRSLEDGHPEFPALRSVGGAPASDSGTIKLNHALHLRLIRRGPSGPTVQLDCGDCHRTAASQATDWPYGDAKYAASTLTYTRKDEFREVSSRGLTARTPASGRELMATPKFVNACAGCHLLTFDARFDEGVPHDTPEVIHNFLVKKFSEYIASHAAELHEVQDPRRSLTGRANGPASRSLSQTQWVAEHVAVSEELLWYKTCSQCHTVSGTTLQDVKIARWDAANSRETAHIGPANSNKLDMLPASSLPKIAPANVTQQWLPHARFDHDAHGGFSCAGCHQGALTSTEASDILIPGIATCQKCHAPGPDHAESRCFECHTYHDWAKRKEVNPTFTLPALRSTGK
jgi:hypothetical protein